MIGYHTHITMPVKAALAIVAACALMFCAMGHDSALPADNPGGEGQSGDWPQFRYDAGRTAASPNSLPDNLQHLWTWTLPKPEPAYPNEIRLGFDASYEPVAAGDMLFVPSMVTDSVTALDTETGKERWRFFAEGPVRFAPVAWEDNVYFVSDDGYLYCVAAEDGSLHWKFRGLPEDREERRVMGDGRFVSLWPARGGPVLQDGVIYFAAGLWPTEGVFIHAVDAESGEAVWSNTDSDLIPESNWDHGVGFDSGLTPQGYLAIVGDTLVVPNGAQLPAFLDIETGELRDYTMGWGGRTGHPKGTWFVAGIGQYLVHGGDLYDITRPYEERVANPDYGRWLYAGGLTRLEPDPANQGPLYDFRQPVLTENVMYESGPEGIRARDITSFTLRERGEVDLPAYRHEDVHPDTFVAEFEPLWEWPGHSGVHVTRQPVGNHEGRWDTPAYPRVHLKAGGRLYTGAPGMVQALDVSNNAEPKLVWRAGVKGEPQRMLAADGKLFVVTAGGIIHAFGPGEDVDNVPYLGPRVPPAPLHDAWTEEAAAILEATGVRDGYALVWGLEEGRLAEELVRQSDLYVIAVDEDSETVDAVRERLHEAGLYGSRAVVLSGNPVDYPFPPYLASLIVSEEAGEFLAADADKLAGAVFHALRPYGGMAAISQALATRWEVQQAFAGTAFPGADVRQSGGYVLVNREGALPGAADWSHAQANAASTGASEDERVGSDLGVLWFDGRYRWHKYPGHVLVRVAGGRRILLEEGLLQAADVYTGRILWETEAPIGVEPIAQAHARDAMRLQRQRRWSPSASLSPATELVALEDAIYVSNGASCLVIDAATGEGVGRIELPGDLEEPWANLRVSGDYLVGSSGQHLLCVNRHTGELIWRAEKDRTGLSLAVGDGKVFCAEVANPRRGEDENRDGSIRALDLSTGEVLWEKDGGARLRYSAALGVLVTSAGLYSAADGEVVTRPPEAEDAQFVIEGRDLPEAWLPGYVAGDKLLTGTFRSLLAYALPSGEPLADEPLTWNPRGCTGTRASVHLLAVRYRSNSAWIDLATQEITPFFGVRPGCTVNINLYPANGVLNMPNLTAGCTCNFSPVSLAAAPVGELRRIGAE